MATTHPRSLNDASISMVGPFDEDELAGHLEEASIPAVLMALYQLTGDHKWLEEPYAPLPPPPEAAEDDWDHGGLSPERQAEVRGAALEALIAWSQGTPPAVPAPQGDVLTEMMSVCVSETIDPQYSPMMATHLGFDDSEDPHPTGPIPDGFSCLVIGAGISGLAMAYRLQIAGIPFRVLERGAEVGGVWRDNVYPGAGVDTANELYSFTFFPRDWSMHYAKRDEMMTYLKEFTDHYDLRRYIEFGSTVVEARYDEDRQIWKVRYTDSEGTEHTAEASALVTAMGIFAEPKIPPIQGLSTFEGPLFHSSQWPEGLDYAGKRLAVVGTGASAMQIVPATADQAESVTVFQRTPSWIKPSAKYFERVSDSYHWLANHVPYYRAWMKFRMAWRGYDRVFSSLWIDPDWDRPDESINARNHALRDNLLKHIRSYLSDRSDLLGKVTPRYPVYGKRLLLDNGWYGALKKPNVELLDEAVVEILPHGLRTESGVERDADIVIMATGFQTTHYLGPTRIHGRGGVELHEFWGDENALAYLGLMTPGYPNLFYTYGPNSQGTGGSFTASAEQQSRFIVQMISKMIDDGIGAVEPKRDLFEEYNATIDEKLESSIWAHPNVTTYYKNRHGRIVIVRPWSMVEFWHMQRTPRMDDYVVEPARRPS